MNKKEYQTFDEYKDYHTCDVLLKNSFFQEIIASSAARYAVYSPFIVKVFGFIF